MMIPRQLATVSLGIATVFGALAIAPSMPSVTPFNLITPVLAKEPPASGSPSGSRPSGVRGDCPNAPNRKLGTLQTLLFQKQVGTTVSGRPMFFWYLSADSPVPLRFVLADPDSGEILVKQTIEKPRAGFMQGELPKNQPELKLGQQYQWSVSLLCSRPGSDASSNLAALGYITRVAAPSTLTRQLALARSLQERAQSYAQQGLWYDALATVWTEQQTRPGDRALRETMLSLLTQMGQTEVVKQERAQMSVPPNPRANAPLP